MRIPAKTKRRGANPLHSMVVVVIVVMIVFPLLPA